MRRLGFLGVGPIARRHAEAALHLGLPIAAASASRTDSPNFDLFEAVAGRVDRLVGLEPLLDRSDLDGMVICPSWEAIEPILPRLLADPRPMLIEKPLAFSNEALEAAISASGRDPAALDNKRIGFNRRYYDSVAALRKRLSQGGLKAVRLVICEDVARQLTRFGPKIAPYLYDFTVIAHALDLLLHLKSDWQLEARAPQTCGGVQALLTAPDGVPATISISLDSTDTSGLTWYFDDGDTYRLQPLERLEVLNGYEILDTAAGVRCFTPKRCGSVSNARETQVTAQGETAVLKPGFLEQMRALCSRADRIGARLADQKALLSLIEALRGAPSEMDVSPITDRANFRAVGFGRCPPCK